MGLQWFLGLGGRVQRCVDDECGSRVWGLRSLGARSSGFN